MSGRRSNVLDIREILRRVRLGESDRAIAAGMKISRKTAKKYRAWAEEMGLTQGPLPPANTLDLLALIAISFLPCDCFQCSGVSHVLQKAPSTCQALSGFHSPANGWLPIGREQVAPYGANAWCIIAREMTQAAR